MSPCPRSLVIPATVVAISGLTAGGVAPRAVAAPSGGSGRQSRDAFVSDTNSARERHDRRVYQVSEHLTEVAQRWARWMARHHRLEHNPRLAAEAGDWQALGENVGCGRAEPPIHHAFMHDSYHRDNILSTTYTQVGVGTARDDAHRLYVDEVFREPSS